MLTDKLTKIRAYALHLKNIIESNYVPMLENNLAYITKVYNYLSNILASNYSLDRNKVENFYNKTIKDFNEISYNLKRLGYHQAA